MVVRSEGMYGARQQAALFVAEGEYYGWKLESVQTKSLGDFAQCTLDFDHDTIVFICRPGSARDAPARSGR